MTYIFMTSRLVFFYVFFQFSLPDFGYGLFPNSVGSVDLESGCGSGSGKARSAKKERKEIKKLMFRKAGCLGLEASPGAWKSFPKVM